MSKLNRIFILLLHLPLPQTINLTHNPFLLLHQNTKPNKLILQSQTIHCHHHCSSSIIIIIIIFSNKKLQLLQTNVKESLPIHFSSSKCFQSLFKILPNLDIQAISCDSRSPLFYYLILPFPLPKLPFTHFPLFYYPIIPNFDFCNLGGNQFRFECFNKCWY